jgi:hypothetical protein
MQFHPQAGELPTFKEKRVISFPSSIFNSLKTESLTTTLDRIFEMRIDVFEYERVQFAIDYENNQSLFVVTNCALVVITYFDPDGIHRDGHPTTG